MSRQRGHGYRDDQRQLRHDPQADAILYLSLGMRPLVKALQRPQWLVRPPGMKKLQGVGKDCSQGPEQHNRLRLRRGEEKQSEHDPDQTIGTDRERILEQRAIESQWSIDLRIHRGGPYGIIPVRNGIEGKMAGKPQSEGCRWMRGNKGGDRRADKGVSAQDHTVGTCGFGAI